jgi:hypothetical protein
MHNQKVYLENGTTFTLVFGACVKILPSRSDLASIDWDSVVELAGGKPDPANVTDGIPNAVLVGEFTDNSDVVRQVYLERAGSGCNQFYYYAAPPHKTYLKKGSALEIEWKSSVGACGRPQRLDIDEELTLSDDNLAHTEVGNDGPVKGTFVKDDVTYNVYVEEIDDVHHFYCYLG